MRYSVAVMIALFFVSTPVCAGEYPNLKYFWWVTGTTGYYGTGYEGHSEMSSMVPTFSDFYSWVDPNIPGRGFTASVRMGSLLSVASAYHNGLLNGGPSAVTRLDHIEIDVKNLSALGAGPYYPAYWKVTGTYTGKGASDGIFHHFNYWAGLDSSAQEYFENIDQVYVKPGGIDSPTTATGSIGPGGPSPGLLVNGNTSGTEFAIFVPVTLYTVADSNVVLISLNVSAGTNSVDGVATSDFSVTFKDREIALPQVASPLDDVLDLASFGAPILVDGNGVPLSEYGVTAQYGFVPEPSTLALGCTALAGLALYLCRRSR